MNVAGFRRFAAECGNVPRPQANTAITTVGAGTLTAAALVGGVITRSGSTADYTDTTATATLILAAMPIPTDIGQSWVVTIKNTVAFAQTITGGTGVTVSGITIIPGLSEGRFLMTYTAAGTVTMVGLGGNPLMQLPYAKYNTVATASPFTIAAGHLTGAQNVFWEITTDGAVTATTRTGTQLFGDTPNAQIGGSYCLKVINKGDNTVTFTAGSGVTITGTNTIATVTTRSFIVTFDSATAVTMQVVDKGTIET